MKEAISIEDTLKMALEVLETYAPKVGGYAITAIKEALAKQSAERVEKGDPVAYMYPDDLERMQTSESFCTVFSVKVGSPDKGLSTVELYTTPQQRTWIGLMRGVRVEGETVVISVKGGNDAARELCGELIKEMNT